MRTRIIVSVVALPVLILIFFLGPVWLIGIAAGIISACCAWEFVNCTEDNASPPLLILSAVAGFEIPFLTVFYDPARVYFLSLLVLFVILMAALMLSFRKDETMELETVACTLMGAGVIPIFLASITRLALRESGNVYAFLPLVVAFSCDIGAYFTGLALGRHKLTPRLSPNKTIEGSIGGFVLAIAITVVYGLILKAAGYEVRLGLMAIYGFLGAVAGQLGDLSFSAVKRLCDTKDFSSLIPGHGGMLDRFDSVIWAAPAVELMVTLVAAISKAA